MAGATRNPELSHLGVPRFFRPVKARLRLDVMTEDTVRIPLCDMLFVIASVGIKERPVKVHPAALNKIVCDRQANPLVAVSG